MRCYLTLVRASSSLQYSRTRPASTVPTNSSTLEQQVSLCSTTRSRCHSLPRTGNRPATGGRGVATAGAGIAFVVAREVPLGEAAGHSLLLLVVAMTIPMWLENYGVGAEWG